MSRMKTGLHGGAMKEQFNDDEHAHSKNCPAAMRAQGWNWSIVVEVLLDDIEAVICLYRFASFQHHVEYFERCSKSW